MKYERIKNIFYLFKILNISSESDTGGSVASRVLAQSLRM